MFGWLKQCLCATTPNIRHKILAVFHNGILIVASGVCTLTQLHPRLAVMPQKAADLARGGHMLDPHWVGHRGR